jgi:hypothetical protein
MQQQRCRGVRIPPPPMWSLAIAARSRRGTSLMVARPPAKSTSTTCNDNEYKITQLSVTYCYNYCCCEQSRQQEATVMVARSPAKSTSTTCECSKHYIQGNCVNECYCCCHSQQRCGKQTGAETGRGGAAGSVATKEACSVC